MSVTIAELKAEIEARKATEPAPAEPATPADEEKKDDEDKPAEPPPAPEAPAADDPPAEGGDDAGEDEEPPAPADPAPGESAPADEKKDDDEEENSAKAAAFVRDYAALREEVERLRAENARMKGALADPSFAAAAAIATRVPAGAEAARNLTREEANAAYAKLKDSRARAAFREAHKSELGLR